MDFKIDSLIPFETMVLDQEYVFSIVEKNGKVVLLKDNKPVYVITAYDSDHVTKVRTALENERKYTLQEAMRIVLSETESYIMHASELADEIYNRKLYYQMDGNKAKYTQIRARCTHHADLFEALPGNYIKLKG